jgi:hypothetical protein
VERAFFAQQYNLKKSKSKSKCSGKHTRVALETLKTNPEMNATAGAASAVTEQSMRSWT